MEQITEDEVMRKIKFSVPGQPFGKQRPKFSRTGVYVKTYTPDKTVSYENLVKLMYQQAAKGKMFSEEEALDVRIIAYYEIPKSISKKKRKAMLEHRLRPTKKPDWDNITFATNSVNSLIVNSFPVPAFTVSLPL